MVDKLDVTDITQLNNMPKLGPTRSKAHAMEVAQEFEAMFIGIMYNIIFEMVKVNPLTGGGKGEEIFRSLLINEHAKNISENSDFGIKEQITKQLLSLQEVT